MKNLVTYSLVVVASLIGSFSLLLFGLFLLGESFTIVDLGYRQPGILAWDALLCLLFFVQHSLMIRKPFRHRLTTVAPRHLQGALYTLVSGVVLIILMLLWQHSHQALISLQGISRWLVYGIFFACLVAMVWSLRALQSVDLLGIQQFKDHNHAAQGQPASLTIQGPYRWVRHPLYFLVLVMIWCCPDVTTDRLLFNVLFTAWIIIGTFLEERDLSAEFGEAYADYQRKVPMLIPYKLFKPNA
jgi:protein-S-isoprenylcysteine O-methyltransferase Ste14